MPQHQQTAATAVAGQRRQCAEILCRTRTFKGVGKATLHALLEHAQLQLLAAGSALFRSGEGYRNSLYILIDGEMVMQRPSGREEGVLPGDFIGLANYLDENPYNSTARINTQTRVLQISADWLRQHEQHNPDLFNALNRVIAAKLRQRTVDRSITSGALAQPVARVMKSPVAACAPQTTLREAFQTMQARNIGSLVVKDRQQRLRGVLTNAGLAEAVLLNGARSDDDIMQAACEEPRVIAPDTPLWEAEELMKRLAVKYLIVVEEQQPIGIVSQSDILRVLTSRPGTLANRIADAADLRQLAALSGQLAGVAADAQQSNHRPSAAIRLLSETHLMLQRRAVELALQWMERHGHGEPPADFALIIMGSGGRHEMLLNPDQDNGLIIADPADADAAATDRWFEQFSEQINEHLDRVGYALCPGQIMARNPGYRKRLSQWKRQVSHVARKPTGKAARWANVLFDFDTLYGNDALTSELRRHALAELQQRPRLLQLMSDHDAEGRPAIGLFNQLITTRGALGERIDIKRNGLRIIADAARIFALQSGVAVQNTSDRLTALMRVGKLSHDFTESIQEAHEALLDQLLRHQIDQAQRGIPPDKLIDPSQLTAQGRSTLRMAMRAVRRFQLKLQDDYATNIF